MALSQQPQSQANSSVSTDLTKSIPTTRFPSGVWTLLVLPYLPIGLCLCLLRICMSLQAILILLIFPEGSVKRFMLRVFFAVLGILVTTDGQLRNTKLFISNKISFLDHIVLHLAGNCISVSSGGCVPPLAPLFPHWTFPGLADDTATLLEAAKALPEFCETEPVLDYVPYAVQPEPLPTNGCHLLLKFSEWPFLLRCSIQPVTLSVLRPFPVAVSTVKSSGWWDLIWMLFIPITIFHAKFLPVLEAKQEESAAEFTERVQQNMASALHIQSTQLTEEDVTKWLEGPPRPKVNGPIILPSEFDPSSPKKSSSSELESMVCQVTAVLPQVPHTVIRRDLLSTRSVDATITNLLEGHVKYSLSSSPSGAGGPSKSMSASLVFRRKVASSSTQRQLSLEERKRELLQNCRRKYMEKHGL